MRLLARVMCGAAAALLTAIHPASSSESVKAFFEGKQLRIIIGFAAGGNSGLYADVLSRHMGRHIPGNPTLVPQYMPGAGGLVAANHMARRAERDGTQIAITSRTAAFEPLLGNKLATFNAREFNWLGSAFIENSVCVADGKTNIRTFDDIRARPLVIGASAGGTIAMVFPKVANQLLGAKFDIVGGYKTGPDILLAIERGEVHGMCGIGWGLLKQRFPELIAGKKMNVLFQIALERASDLPDAPLVHELAGNEDDRRLLEFLAMPQNMGRPFFAPPGVPADRVKALREAFVATMKDREFQADAHKTGLELDLVTGEEVHALLDRAYSIPPALVERARKLLAE
jgi:tripartite-type tricarboxylate transporter receptor subunit TctC